MKMEQIKKTLNKLERNRKQDEGTAESSNPKAPEGGLPGDAKEFTRIDGEDIFSITGGGRPGKPTPPH